MRRRICRREISRMRAKGGKRLLPGSRLAALVRPCAITLALAACAAPVALPPPGPVAGSLAVAKRGWHTDVCLRREDAEARIAALARGFEDARFLCFGFGERDYMVEQDHGPLTMLSALLPSRATLVATALRDPPATAFGAANVASIGVSRAGLAGFQAFVLESLRTDGAGQPVQLSEDAYRHRDSVFYAATATYDGFYTCNTWTGDALRSAGVPVNDGALFAGDVMRQVRKLAGGEP